MEFKSGEEFKPVEDFKIATTSKLDASGGVVTARSAPFPRTSSSSTHVPSSRPAAWLFRLVPGRLRSGAGDKARVRRASSGRVWGATVAPAVAHGASQGGEGRSERHGAGLRGEDMAAMATTTPVHGRSVGGGGRDGVGGVGGEEGRGGSILEDMGSRVAFTERSGGHGEHWGAVGW